MRYMSPHTAVRIFKLDDKFLPKHRETGRSLPRLSVSGGKDFLFFYENEVLSWRLHGKFLLYVHANPEVLEQSKNSAVVGFPAELRVLEMSLQAEIERPGERTYLTHARDKCIKQMFLKFTQERGMDDAIAFRELAARFGGDARKMRRIIRGKDEDPTRDIRFYKKMFNNDPRLNTLRTALGRARVLATTRKYGGATVGIEHLLPFHAGSGVQYIPPACPVLGFKLDYDPKSKSVNAVRVGRGSVASPFAPGNAFVMSKLAARMIEGSVSPKVASLSMDPEMGKYWKEWARLHATNMGKTVLGGARKAIGRGRQAELIRQYGENIKPAVTPAAKRHMLEKLGIIEREEPKNSIEIDDLMALLPPVSKELKDLT